MAVRVLVVGAGSIGRRHHGNLAELGAKATLRGWRDYGLTALEADLRDHDALVAATATDLRLPLIERAAAAGRPVFVEKPLAFAPDEVEAIARVAAPIADRSMLGYMMRYHPGFRTLAAADLSDVFQFTASIGHDVTQWRANWRFSDSYAARAAGGGVLLDLCHELDMIATLLPGLSVQSVTSHGHAAYPGVDIASRISLSGGGRAGEVAMDYLTPRLHRRTILRGTGGMWDFDYASQSYRLTNATEEQIFDRPLDRNTMFLDIMRDFLALVQGHAVSGVEHLPRLDLALPSARLVASAWAARNFIGTIDKEIP